jgi:hypothetical protein
MRVPGEALQVIPGIIGTKIIEEQEWIECWDLAETKCPLQVDAGSLNGGFALDDFADLPGFPHAASPFCNSLCSKR